jgi:hypothetical protein
VPSLRQNRSLNLDDFIQTKSFDQSNQEEYFELRHKFDNMKKVNGKIYNYALEKIFNS